MKPKTLLAGLSTAALVALAAFAQPGVQGTSNQPPTPHVPRILRVVLRFDTGSDGKDFDTKLHVFMYPAGFKVGTDERKGAILGYMSGSTATPYPAGSTRQIDLSDYTSGSPQYLPATLDRDTFVGTHGGRLYLNFFRNGHDTWIVKDMVLSIVMEGATPRNITLPGFTTKEGGPAVVLDLDENFRLIKR